MSFGGGTRSRRWKRGLVHANEKMEISHTHTQTPEEGSRPRFGGKIQGDGRKFLELFKSYFGSQISSQSLNEVHI